MPTGRDFIRQQDDEIEALRAEHKRTADAFASAVKVNAADDEQVRRLCDMHSAGTSFYRMVEEAMHDRDGLRGDDFESWRHDRIGSALNVLTGLLKYHRHLRKHRDRLGLQATMFEPAPAVYQNMQAALAAARPDSARELKEAFQAANLPTSGFDHPYTPEPAPMEEKKPSDRHASAAMPLFFFIVAVFGILALACIGGGIYAVFNKAVAETAFELWGFNLKTGHVGVAFVGIGLATALFTVRAVLKKL
jgi:hypothetical protein